MKNDKFTTIVLTAILAVPLVATVVILSTAEFIKNKVSKDENNDSEKVSLE